MTPYGGGATSVTPGFATSTKIDLNQIGEARNSMLGIKLDQVSNYHQPAQPCPADLTCPMFYSCMVLSCRSLIQCQDRLL